MLIISLSSIPSRFDQLGPVLEALAGQEVRADHVILYLPKVYRRFPDYDGRVPKVPSGIEIRQPEVDYGPASKVLHAVRDFADTPNADILFCDDDLIYEPDWSRQFVNARLGRPDNPLCSAGWNLDFLEMESDAATHQPGFERQSRTTDWGYRWRKLGSQLAQRKFQLERHEKPWRNLIERSGYVDTFEGYGGVMVQPRYFDHDAFDIPDVLWTVDDVWLSGICVKNGHRPWAIASASRFTYTPSRHTDALNQSVIEGADRTHANRLCAEYMQKTYGIWGGHEGGTEPQLSAP